MNVLNRWIGAWWLGFPIIGVLILVFAFPLAFFPQRLPKQNTDANKREEIQNLKKLKSHPEEAAGAENLFKQTSADFTEAFKRLLTNKLFMYNFFSSLVSLHHLWNFDKIRNARKIGYLCFYAIFWRETKLLVYQWQAAKTDQKFWSTFMTKPLNKLHVF